MNSQPRTHETTDAAERRMNQLLAQAGRQAWTGPDHSPRVEQHLKGITMKAPHKLPLSRTAMLLIGVGVLAGGSLAAAVTHQVLSRRVTLIAPDGTQFDGELSETADGAAGTFIADDGTIFEIEMVEGAGEKNVTVDVNSPTGGTSTVIVDGAAPRVTTAPGQTARIQIGTTADPDDGETTDDDQSDD